MKKGLREGAEIIKMLRWLPTPAGRALVRVLIFLLVLPPWPVQELPRSYRWSLAPYQEVLNKIIAFLEPAEARAAFD